MLQFGCDNLLAKHAIYRHSATRSHLQKSTGSTGDQTVSRHNMRPYDADGMESSFSTVQWLQCMSNGFHRPRADNVRGACCHQILFYDLPVQA